MIDLFGCVTISAQYCERALFGYLIANTSSSVSSRLSACRNRTELEDPEGQDSTTSLRDANSARIKVELLDG